MAQVKTVNNSIKTNLNKLHISDIYSLMCFILYKVQEVPEYAVLSELCYLLDGGNLTRLLTYFAGKTIKIPSNKDFAVLVDALLLYQYINIEGDSLIDAQNKITDLTAKQKDEALELYLKIMPIVKQYNINRDGKADNKADDQNRTFETRTLFLKDVFDHPFTREQLMTKSIEAKLNNTYFNYEKELEKSLSTLKDKDPQKVAKKM